MRVFGFPYWSSRHVRGVRGGVWAAKQITVLISSAVQTGWLAISFVWPYFSCQKPRPSPRRTELKGLESENTLRKCPETTEQRRHKYNEWIDEAGVGNIPR
jgi:hypothetical protein